MDNLHSKTVLLMAGGTGGHIFPALALAQFLREHGMQVAWLGSKGGMEERLVPSYGITLETVAIKGVRGHGLLRKLLLPFTLFNTVRAAKKIIREKKVDIVVGFGGFVSVPGALAAKLSRVPLVIHEQNALAGLSNRLLSRLANRVLYAFPKVFADPQGLVGNPVRSEITQLPAPKTRFEARTGPLKLLVMGGSLGADVLNATVPAALKLLRGGERFSVLHQTGKGKAATTQALYDAGSANSAGSVVNVQCVEFIDDIAKVYAEVDLVICRAGALTIAELTSCGLGALLVPYPFAVDNHQTANARFMVSSNAGLLLPQSELSASNLAEVLGSLSRETCLMWAKQARTLAMPESTAKIAQAVSEWLK